MEATTAPARGTGSRTIADLLPRAAQRFGDDVAVKHRSGEDWVDLTFAQIAAISTEIGAGLLALGIAPGDRVSIPGSPRPSCTATTTSPRRPAS